MHHRPGTRTGRCALVAAAVLALFAAAGCREVNGTVYSEFAKVGPSGWDPRNVVGFDPWPADSLNARGEMDVVLCVRYSGREPMPPLLMAVEADDENGTLLADTIRMPMFDAAGEPTGKGRYGVYQLTDTIMRRYRLRPGFGVEIAQLGDMADTRGVLNVGVILTRSGTGSSGLDRLMERLRF